MARGPKKHMKRIQAPRSWLLDKKMGGIFVSRPSQGPHKLRQSLPLALILKRRLKYSLSLRESITIVNDKEGGIKIDGKIRRDTKYPTGLMDVISIDKSGEHFRMLFDVKGRFALRAIKSEEAKFKLCKIVRREVGPNKIPYVVTHDGRTLRFPHPEIAVHDTVKLDIATSAVLEHAKFEPGNTVMVTQGNNVGRVGVITSRERHFGGFDIIHIRDARGHSFATRISNVFVIGRGKNPWISLPKEKGVYLTPVEKTLEGTTKVHRKKSKSKH